MYIWILTVIVMIKNLDLAPLSLNPEHADQEPSSPINFLNGKNKQYKQSLLKQK